MDARGCRSARPWHDGRNADARGSIARRPPRFVRSTAGLRSARCASSSDGSRADATIEVDTNPYSVPVAADRRDGARWRCAGGRVSVRHCGGEVASHGEIAGRRQRAMVAAHLEGLAALGRPPFPASQPAAAPAPALVEPELLRPLAEYEAGWRGRLVMNPDRHALADMLTRLQLTAIRDQLDSLLDEAARRELTLREARGPPVRARGCPARRTADRDGEQDRPLSRRCAISTASTSPPSPRSTGPDPRTGRLPLGRPWRRAAAAGAAWGRQDASGDRARPRSDPRRLFGAVRHRAGAGRGLAKAHAEGRLDERLGFFAKPKLLIVDELGYLPFDPNAAHLFFQLVSRRYERGSLLITSNRSVGEWGTVFGDPVVATAILDRLLHHSSRRHHPRRQLPTAREAAGGLIKPAMLDQERLA